MNRVYNQTEETRNKALLQLKIIYDDEWEDHLQELENLIKEPQKNKFKIAGMIAIFTILTNKKAIPCINKNIEKVYKINSADIIDQVYNTNGVKIEYRDIFLTKTLNPFTLARYNEFVDNAFVKKQILDRISLELGRGTGTKKIAKVLQTTYNYNKVSAMRTVLTETTRFQSLGRLEAMNEANKKGVKFKKIWRHSFYVKNPRDTHIMADGQERALNEPFDIDGVKMMCPGDRAGGAGNNCNCHCFLDEVLL